jgi:hypothetical protein
MRQFVVAALLTVSVVGAAWAESPQEEQNITRCNDPTDPDIRISGCTAVIQSGGGIRDRLRLCALSLGI